MRTPPVESVVESLELPEGVKFVDPARAQLVFLFAKSREDLETRMPTAVASLAPGAGLWVFLPQGWEGRWARDDS